jgi:hypothetical protein
LYERRQKASAVPSAPQYILDNFAFSDCVARLAQNRDFGENHPAHHQSRESRRPEFHAGFRYKNANGSGICVTCNRTGWFVLPFAASWFGPGLAA